MRASGVLQTPRGAPGLAEPHPCHPEVLMDPDDPLGVDEIVAARRDWDAQIAADKRRWDAFAPLYEDTVAAREQNQPADLHDDGPPALMRVPGENDHLVERTDNGLRPDDLQLDQPPQSPPWDGAA